MRLVLVRHGEAEGPRGNDAERTLTDTGREQARQTGRWLAERLQPDVQLFCSPYLRAQQTAREIGDVLRCQPVVIGHVTPEDDPRLALKALEAAATAECVVVVTHMPLVAALAAWLEEGVLSSRQGFMLAEARIMDMDVIGPGSAVSCARFAPDAA